MTTPLSNPWSGRLLVGLAATIVASLAVAGMTNASVTAVGPHRIPASTPPPPAVPDGTGARVVLGCGRDAATRVVVSFDAPVDPGQTPILYWADPASVNVEPVTVGSEVPATPILQWQISGIFLGPWPVGTVSDTCISQSPDGSGALLRLRCGPTAASREILSFQAPVEPDREAVLYLATAGSGGETLTEVTERQIIPAFSELRWSIRDVQLGPWTVGSVDDPCGVLATPLPPGTNGGHVLLSCGSRPTTRVIASFEAPVEPGQEAILTLVSTGSIGTPAQVGDEVPESPGLVWSIRDIQLGPWTVQTVTDQCSSQADPTTTAGPAHTNMLPGTGTGVSMSLALVASGLAGIGLALIGLGRRPGRQRHRHRRGFSST